MFAWKPEEERAKYGPHEFKYANLGHGGNMLCKYCSATPNEIAVIGDPNHCEKQPPEEGV